MDEKQERKIYREAKKLDAHAKALRDQFIRQALTTREGREYFYWLLGICKIGQQPFVNNALLTAFGCGELNVGQQVQAHIIEVSPGMFLTMLTEKEEERKNATRRNDSNDADTSAGDDAAE